MLSDPASITYRWLTSFATTDFASLLKAAFGGFFAAGGAVLAGVSDGVLVATIGAIGTVLVAIVGVVPAMRRIGIEQSDSLMRAQVGLVEQLQDEIKRLHDEHIARRSEFAIEHASMRAEVAQLRQDRDVTMKALREAHEKLCECVKCRDDLASKIGGRRFTDQPGDGS